MSKHIVTTYLARFAAVLSTLVLVPLVAPRVGLEAYGLYALVTSLGILFAQDLGMAAATTRFTADAWARRDLSRLREVCSASAWFFLFLGMIITVVLAFAYALVFPGVDKPDEVQAGALVAIALANGFFGMALASHRQILAGVGYLDLANYVQIGQAVCRVLLTLVVVVWSPDVVLVAAADLTATVVGGLVAWLVRRLKAPATRSRWSDFSRSVFGELARFSSDLLVMTVAAVVILQSGTVLASLLLPLGAVAVYTAANRAFLFVREAANSLTMALLPTSSTNAALGDVDANRRLFIRGTRLANSMMVLLLVPVIVFAGPLLNWWVGGELAAGHVAAQILILSMLANNNHLVAIPVLTGMGAIRPYAVLHAIWAISGVGLTIILAPRFGVSGIAAGLSLPVFLLEPAYLYYAVRRIGVTWTEFLRIAVLPPYLVSALPAALLVLVAVRLDAPSLLEVVAMTLAWVIVVAVLYSLVLWSGTDRSKMWSRVKAEFSKERVIVE